MCKGRGKVEGGCLSFRKGKVSGRMRFRKGKVSGSMRFRKAKDVTVLPALDTGVPVSNVIVIVVTLCGATTNDKS